MSMNGNSNSCIKYSPAISEMEKKRITAIVGSFQHVNGDMEYKIQLRGDPKKIWANRRDLIGTKVLEDYENNQRKRRGSGIYYGTKKKLLRRGKNKDNKNDQNSKFPKSRNLSDADRNSLHKKMKKSCEEFLKTTGDISNQSSSRTREAILSATQLLELLLSK